MREHIIKIICSRSSDWRVLDLIRNYVVEGGQAMTTRLAFAATMIRPGYLADSNVAQLISMSAFLHRLGQKRKSSVGLGMSALGGKADIDFGPLDVCF